MIITRYLTKEIFGTLLATTVMLLLIFISNQLISYMRSAAGGHLSGHTVFLLLSLQTPVLLTILLPLSLFLGILLAYGRLYADSEMTVLSACGVSVAKLFRIAIRFALVVMVLVAVLALWVAPTMEDYSERVFASSQADVLDLLVPGRFSSIPKSKWVFYVEDMVGSKKHLDKVFAAEDPEFSININDEQRTLGIVFAKGGHQMIDKDGNKFLVLTDGNRYIGMPGRRDYKIINFGEYGISLNMGDAAKRFNETAVATKTLLKNLHDPVLVAELNWRLSLPIAVFILALLAVPLSKVKPRYGRYASLIPAVIFFIIYVNFMFLGRAWLIKKIVPLAFGMWWVHLVMLILVLMLICYQVGWSRLQNLITRK